MLTLIARCTYVFSNGTQNNAVSVRGELQVSPADPGIEDACIGNGYCGMSWSTTSPAASTTYSATADFEATQSMIPVDTKQLTASHTTPLPQRPRTDPPIEVHNPFNSPIVISLHGGYSLSGADDPVLFDIDADGVKSRTGWIARGSEDAFLALDRDGDGRIGDGRELFGDATLLRNGTSAGNGFEALKELDDNGDGRIDSSDRVWTDLLLWHDADHDGVSTASELVALSTTTVAALHLDYHWTGRRDRHGNELRYQASLDLVPHGRRAVYDIFFIGLP